MRRLALIALSLLSVAGCGRKDTSLYADPVRAAKPAAAASGSPLYVGRWAATLAACPSGAWLFTKDGLTGPSATCEIVAAQQTPAGYIANTLCTLGQAAPKAGRLVMTLTGPAAGDSMTLSAWPFDPALSLVRCAA